MGEGDGEEEVKRARVEQGGDPTTGPWSAGTGGKYNFHLRRLYGNLRPQNTAMEQEGGWLREQVEGGGML